MFSLASLILGFSLDQAWPFLPASAGAAGLYAGIRKRNRFSADFVIPSIAYLLLSGFFLLFSFDVIDLRLTEFVRLYWLPLLAFCVVFMILSVLFYRKAGKKLPRAT